MQSVRPQKRTRSVFIYPYRLQRPRTHRHHVAVTDVLYVCSSVTSADQQLHVGNHAVVGAVLGGDAQQALQETNLELNR